MKTRTFIVTMLVVLLSTGIKAQEFNFGAQAGFVISHTYMTDTKGSEEKIETVNEWFDPMPSFGINAYLAYKSSGIWGLSVLPGYIQKGSSNEYTYEGETTFYRRQLHYANIPLLFDMFFLNNFCVSVGPELGFLLKANSRSKDDNNDIGSMYDKNFELSVQGGISYDLWRGLVVGANYSHGLTNLFSVNYTDNEGNPLGEMKHFNQYGQFFVRYKF